MSETIHFKVKNGDGNYIEAPFLEQGTMIRGPFEVSFQETKELVLEQPLDVPNNGVSVGRDSWIRLALGLRVFKDDTRDARVKEHFEDYDMKLVLQPQEHTTANNLFIILRPKQ